MTGNPDNFLTWIIHGPRPTHPTPIHPFIKEEEAACEGVVIYVGQAATKPMP